jgi:hypothetical protein
MNLGSGLFLSGARVVFVHLLHIFNLRSQYIDEMEVRPGEMLVDVYISMDIALECLHLCRNESLSQFDVDYSHARILPRIRGVSACHMACVQYPALEELHTRSNTNSFVILTLSLSDSSSSPASSYSSPPHAPDTSSAPQRSYPSASCLVPLSSPCPAGSIAPQQPPCR